MNFNFELLNKLMVTVADFIPTVLGFIAFILISWAIIKIILFTLKKILGALKIDILKRKINNSDLLKNVKFEINPLKSTLSIIKWVLILITIIIGADLFNLTTLSDTTKKLVIYLPQLAVALVIFVLGMYLASVARKTVQKMLKTLNVGGTKAMGLLVFYCIAIITSIMALDQAGINTNFITKNLTLIIGISFGAFALALGLGSKDIVHSLILGYYSKKNLKVGDKIDINGTSGIIEAINNISLVLLTPHEKIIFPIKEISKQKIKILN